MLLHVVSQVWQRLAESEDLAGKVTAPIRLKMQNGSKALTPEGGTACTTMLQNPMHPVPLLHY